MKRPQESDFKIESRDSGVEVIFIPTESHYNFSLLADEERAKHGPFSSYVKVRHSGPTGDTGDYIEKEVTEIAHLLAERHVRIN
jgi:hypothetical protein